MVRSLQAVQAPTRRGFGTTLIERALTHELDAEVRREFAVSGLHCTIEIPLTEEVARAPRPLQPRRRIMTQDGPAGLRILVVEDETLIAVLIEDVLKDLRCEVVGPVSRLDAALRLAQEGALDSAILDVRIRGGQVYPVTEQLLARKIPFSLVSGYDDWVLPESLREQPRLTKPFRQHHLEEQVRAAYGKLWQRPGHQPRKGSRTSSRSGDLLVLQAEQFARQCACDGCTAGVGALS
jgi:CheY-like chemotaxis protein